MCWRCTLEFKWCTVVLQGFSGVSPRNESPRHDAITTNAIIRYQDPVYILPQRYVSPQRKVFFLFQLVWMSVLLKYEYTSLLTFIWTMISEHDRPKESYTSWFVRGEFQRSHHCERSTTIFRPTRLWSPCVIHRQWRTSCTCWSKPSSTNRWRLGGWNTSCRTCPTTHPHCWAAHGCNLCWFTCRCTRQPNGGCS